MSVANGTLKSDAARVRDDARRLGRHTQEGGEHLRESLPDFARQARDLFEEGLDRLRGQGSDVADEAGEQLENARLYVVEHVRERPMTVTLAALGVGVLVGLLFAGSRK